MLVMLHKFWIKLKCSFCHYIKHNKTAGKLVLADLSAKNGSGFISTGSGGGWEKGWSGRYPFSFFVIGVLGGFCQLNKA